jgi:hypothetical protein
MNVRVPLCALSNLGRVPVCAMCRCDWFACRCVHRGHGSRAAQSVVMVRVPLNPQLSQDESELAYANLPKTDSHLAPAHAPNLSYGTEHRMALRAVSCALRVVCHCMHNLSRVLRTACH